MPAAARPRTYAARPRSRNGAALQRWMGEIEMRPEELARLMDVSRATVYLWRSGFAPKRRHTIAIAKLSGGRVPFDGWDD